jgi:hypothetical protein
MTRVPGPHHRVAVAVLSLLGFATAFSFETIGIVYYGELLMAAVAPWVLIHNLRSHRAFTGSFLLMMSMLTITAVAYVVADLVNQTSVNNALRGSGRLFFIFTNVISLYLLSRPAPHNLRYFCLGFASGDAISLFLDIDAVYLWKHGFAIPFTILLILILPRFSLRHRPALATLLLIMLAVAHVMLDYRSLGAVCLILALVNTLKTPRELRFGKWRLLRLGLAACSGLGLFVYFYIDSELLYSSRRSDSNAFRASAYVTSLQAVVQEPLFGFGSWSYSPDVQWVFQQALEDRGTQLKTRFDAHSQLLQAWFEGGIFATTFFVYLTGQIFLRARFLIFSRRTDAMTLLYLFFLVLGLWDVFMSPLAGFHRLRISVLAVVLIHLTHEEKWKPRLPPLQKLVVTEVAVSG